MNLEDLRSVQADERRADSLQALPDDFYRNVATYIEGLREQRAHAAERADDPFGSEEVRMLTDEIETAEEVAEAVYERRVGKVVKQASLAAAGVPADEEGLTDEERALFRDLVGQIEAHREEVLASFGGDADFAFDEESPDPDAGFPADDDDGSGDSGDPAPPPDRPDDAEARAVTGEEDEADLDAGAAMGEGADEPDDSDAGSSDATGDDAATEDAEESSEDRTTVRITTDVGEIFGVDEHTYELVEEDVVRLPTANAEPLIERDAAQKLE